MKKILSYYLIFPFENKSTYIIYLTVFLSFLIILIISLTVKLAKLIYTTLKKHRTKKE